tara:strand:+ start:120 stop:605 length:486 start_codon:yes stop_codon:yes gene_type:complete
MFPFAFTKPTQLTRSQKNNKYKATIRSREKAYWADWSRKWHEKRDCLELTFRIWSGKKKTYHKNAHIINKPSKHSTWVGVVQGDIIPDFMKKTHIKELKKVLHCLSMKDISWDFYNDLIYESHKFLIINIEREKQRQNDEIKNDMYLDWDVSTRRRKKKRY